MSTLTEKTKVTLGLAIAVIGGGAWWLSAFYGQVQTMNRDMSEMKAEVTETKKLVSEFGTNQKLILQQLKSMERPVVHTRADVRSVKQSLQAMVRVPRLRVASVCPSLMGPFGMQE